MSTEKAPTEHAAEGGHGVQLPQFFKSLAASYARQTGDSTRNIFAATLDDITALLPITSDSHIHDNAAGPGTATSVLVDRIPTTSRPTIVVTDNVPAMVAAARDLFNANPSVTVQEMDSMQLEFPDKAFSHSILAFSIFAMADPLKCIQETRRTLKPDGVAAWLTWRRFGVVEVVRAAQRFVRPDLPAMPLPRPEFLSEGVLAKLVLEGGFEESKTSTLTKRLVVTGQDLENLKGFILGDFTKPARTGWSDEEVATWPEAVEHALATEVGTNGGVLFEAWVVLARA